MGVVWTFLLSYILSFLFSLKKHGGIPIYLKILKKVCLGPFLSLHCSLYKIFSWCVIPMKTLARLSWYCSSYFSYYSWGGRVVRWCWVNFRCRGVLLIWILVGQGPTVLAVGAGGVVWTFLLSSIFSLLFLPLSGRRPDIDWNTVSKRPLNPKQPTNHPFRP